jgi:hypothetical protein
MVKAEDKLHKVCIQHGSERRPLAKPLDPAQRAAFKRLEKTFGESYWGANRGMRMWFIYEQDLEEFRQLAAPYEVDIVW